MEFENLMKEEKKVCEERGYHSFVDEKGGLDLDKVKFIEDNFEEATINLTCVYCGMTAELTGSFED